MRARTADRTSVIVIETDPLRSTDAGGHWWDVAVPEVSSSPGVVRAHEVYREQCRAQRIGD